MNSSLKKTKTVRLSVITLILLTMFCNTTSCTTKSSTTLKLGVITDLHYLSEGLINNRTSAETYATTSGRNILATPEVLDIVLNEYLKSGIDVLLISGDLTKDGEKQSHLDLIKKLDPLKNEGIRVYVIPGNHDINIPNAISFEQDGNKKTKSIENADEFALLYRDFGYASALNRDTASLSYVAELSDNKWLLAIDACLYKEHTNSSITKGKISAETEQWIMQSLQEAKEKNITVIGMMHHGLVEHIIYQNAAFPQYLVDDWNRLANKFADAGLKAIFTGHFHATDITKFTSNNGNSIYDIETGALCTYPFAYRFVEFSETGLDIKTKNIKSTSNFPNLAEVEKNRLTKIAERLAQNKLKSIAGTFPLETINRFSELAAIIFLKHVEGDETIDNSIKDALKNISSDLDMPIDLNPDMLQLDFFPADNNVTISFD